MIGQYGHVRDPRRVKVLRWVEALGYLLAFTLLSTRWWWLGVLLVAVCMGMTITDLRERAPAPAGKPSDPRDKVAFMVILPEVGDSPIPITLRMVHEAMSTSWDALVAVLDPAGATVPQRAAAAASALMDLSGDPPVLSSRGVRVKLVVHGLASICTESQLQQLQRVAQGELPSDADVARYLARVQLLSTRSGGASPQYFATPMARAIAKVRGTT